MVTTEDGSIWIFGGDNPLTTNELFKLDPPVKEWSSITSVVAPSPRRLHAMAAVRASLYVFGGTLQNARHTDELWVFSTRTMLWKQLVPDDTAAGAAWPSARSEVRMAVVGDHVYAFGGIRVDSPVLVLCNAPSFREIQSTAMALNTLQQQVKSRALNLLSIPYSSPCSTSQALACPLFCPRKQ